MLRVRRLRLRDFGLGRIWFENVWGSRIHVGVGLFVVAVRLL